MVKKPTISPPAEFAKNAVVILKQLMTSSLRPVVNLASMDAYNAGRDKLIDLLDLSPSAIASDDFRPILVEIGDTLKAYEKTNENQLRVKKDAAGYTFEVTRKSTQGGSFTFSTLSGSFPGSTLPQFRTNLSADDKLSILWAMLIESGFSFTPNDSEFTAYHSPTIILDDKKGRGVERPDPPEIIAVDNTGLLGVLSSVEKIYGFVHSTKMANAAFQAQLLYKVEVEVFGMDVSVTISPQINIAVSSSMIPYMAEAQDKSAIDFLSITWFTDIVHRASSNARGKSGNLPAIDMRITSDQLRRTKDRFGVAKPRLNKYGFCINNRMLPMFVPERDDSTAFMKDNSNYSISEEGYLEYEEVGFAWASRIISVDWFNDVIVYTTSTSKIAIQRLLGYVPLDRASEYTFLNTPTYDVAFKDVLKNLTSVIQALISPSDAQAFLSPDYATPTSYNTGKITQDFLSLFTQFSLTFDRGNLELDDPGFLHEGSLRSPLIKHMFGLDLHELPTERHRGMGAQVAAYLKAAGKQRKDISLAVMNRLSGLEYFLVMADKLEKEYGDIKATAIEEREKRRPSARLLDVVDIPNLDAGEDANTKGFMPHQVRILSDYAQGADSGMTGAAPGSGKSLMQLCDVLMKLEKNPTWRPICVTKPSLVEGLISEFNFFSKGKVNVVSLKMSQLRYIQQTMRLTTATAFLKWVKSLPINTIFVCAYTDFASSASLFDDLDVPKRVLLEDVGLPQFLHLLRIIGFDVVELDESHMIKNMDSKRTRYSLSLMAQAKVKKVMSGTLSPNTVYDLIGQTYAVNPMVFGSDQSKFEEKYNVTSGLIKSDEAAQKLNERMKKFIQMSAATKEDSAFLLPDLYDNTLTPLLTPKQEKFYQSLLLAAELELKAKLENKNTTVTGSNEDEDEDDEESTLMAMIDVTLAKAEQFIIAPDSNQQYLDWADKPVGDDLIAPAVKAIDKKLDEIYRDHSLDHRNNKTAVFGVHKVFSGHFMKYTKHKNICLHYRAGDREVLRKFKTDPDKWILVGDSTSLKEGENLQMISHIFEAQCHWDPGSYEQLVSRMYRPDPKGIYNKDRVDHYWVTPELSRMKPSVAAIKLARMISKAVSLARLQYEKDPRWREISWQFEDLDLLKMNLKFIFKSDKSDLEPYLGAWEKFIRWQRNINRDQRLKVARLVEEQNPGVKILGPDNRILDRNLFTKLVMREARSTKMLPGSKRVFTPWAMRAVPADIYDLSLSILGSDEIERGTYVMTEYGPGIVTNVGESQLDVELYGRKRAKIYRERIAVPNGEGIKKMNEIVNSPSAWQGATFTEVMHVLKDVDPEDSVAPRTKRPRGDSAPAPTPVPTVAPKRPVEETPRTPVVDKKTTKPSIRDLKNLKDEKEEDEENTDTPIEEIYTYLMNGMPALVILEAPSGVEDLGWNRVAPFVGMRFKNWKVADNFIGTLTKRFAMTQSKLDTLEEEMAEFQQGTSMKLTRRVTETQARNFFITNHRKLSASKDGRERVDPFWIAIDKNIFLAFSTESHSTKVISWLKTIASKNAGNIRPPQNFPEMWVNIFNSLSEAATDLKALGQRFNIPEAQMRQELREMTDDVKAMRAKRTVPSR